MTRYFPSLHNSVVVHDLRADDIEYGIPQGSVFGPWLVCIGTINFGDGLKQL